MMRHLFWFWCWLCFRFYLAAPIASTHKSLYGRFMLWVLGYAGYYAHTPSPFRRRKTPEVSRG